MMRALAEYIMRGRLQAITIALLGSWVPLLNQAAVGLVSLRKGGAEGMIITLWAILPSLMAAWLGNVGLAMVAASVAVLVLTYISALLLRATVSWAYTLVAVVVMSALLALLVSSWVGDIDVQLNQFFTGFLQSEGEQAGSVTIHWTTISASGAIGFWIGLSVVAGLLIARWWQAMLYNPGGFGLEFRALRLPTALALVCLAAMLFCLSRGVEYAFWSSLLGLPLLLAGIALLHFIVKTYQLKLVWLVIFYFALVVFKPLSLLVSLLAVFDSGFDLRKRINVKP